MSGAVPKISLGDMSRFKVAVISASWHKEVCDALIAGAKRALLESKVTISPVIFVPGSFELPLAAQYALDSGADAAVVLGVVVRGETPHFDYVCQIGFTCRDGFGAAEWILLSLTKSPVPCLASCFS